MPNNHRHKTCKSSTYQGNCYTSLNHSRNLWGYYLKPLTADRHEALLQMQKMDPFCKCITKQLSNGKAPKHKADLLTHIKGSLCKYIMDANQKFVALIIPKALKYTVLVEAHDKLRHQGITCTYYVIKWQYYWKGMNKDIQKYIANLTLCHKERARCQSYPLQKTEIPDKPFNKIDLVTECETSTSGNRYILTIIDGQKLSIYQISLQIP